MLRLQNRTISSKFRLNSFFRKFLLHLLWRYDTAVHGYDIFVALGELVVSTGSKPLS
jgi:hypothetical protein